MNRQEKFDAAKNKIERRREKSVNGFEFDYYYSTDGMLHVAMSDAIATQMKIDGGNTMQQSVNEKLVKVKAFSKEHAAKTGATLARVDLASIDSVSTINMPRDAKTCTTTDYPAKGTRKWVTVYNIYSYGVKVAIGRNKFEYTHLELVESGIDQKVPAVARARELAIKYQMPMTVKLEKEIVDGSPFVSDIEPKTTPGSFEIKVR